MFFLIRLNDCFCIAGSAGDPNAPQLIVENRSVSIEYGREQADRRGKEDHNKRDDKTRSVKTDWLCEAVSNPCFVAHTP